MANGYARKAESGGLGVCETVALVLVLLIAGYSVLNGDQYITNARAKRFVTFIRAVEAAQWVHAERVGKFAEGMFDLNTGGIPFSKTLRLGGRDYTVCLGSQINDAPPSLVVWRKGARLDEQDLNLFAAFDTAIDGEALSHDGRVRALSRVSPIGKEGDDAVAYVIHPAAGMWGVSDVVGLAFFFDMLPM